MSIERLNEILEKSDKYIKNTKPLNMHLHSYFVYINLTQSEYAKLLKAQEGSEGYENIKMALNIIEHAKDIIISNILTTQVLNPYSKNGAIAMQYLKIISREFRDEGEQPERLNIVIKSGDGPISLLKKGDK